MFLELRAARSNPCRLICMDVIVVRPCHLLGDLGGSTKMPTHVGVFGDVR